MFFSKVDILVQARETEAILREQTQRLSLMVRVRVEPATSGSPGRWDKDRERSGEMEKGQRKAGKGKIKMIRLMEFWKV